LKILLIQPPIEDFYLTEVRTYPLGILYLATMLKNHGIDVSVLDCLSPYKKKTIPLPKEFNYIKKYYTEKEVGPIKLFGQYYRFGLSDEDILGKVKENSPDFILITANFTAYFNVIANLAKKIKNKFQHTKIIIGGYHATVYKDNIEKKYSCFDYIVKGSNETNLLDILGYSFSSNFCFSKIIPDRSLINSQLYKMHGQNFSFLVATRGCLQNCSFCTVASMYGNNYVVREAESILQEMLDLYTNHQVRVFDFEDDNLSFNKEWFEKLLDAIIKIFPEKDIILYAMNGISIENLSFHLLKKMKEAGFRNLNISLVTAQDSLKEKLKRPFKNEKFEEIITLAKKLGYEITVYFIVGLPNQKKTNLQATIDYLSKFDILLAPSFYYPPPGTKEFDTLVENNVIDPNNWISFRSSVFPVETKDFSREEQVYFFSYIRLINFMSSLKMKYNLVEINYEKLELLSNITIDFPAIELCKEEEIGIAQAKEFLKNSVIKRIYSR
jgi:anaerobic magnesium-protoporphyrin IX monomethyl ester cyclase